MHRFTLVLAESNRNDLEKAKELVGQAVNDDSGCTVQAIVDESELLALLDRKQAVILLLDLHFPGSDNGIEFLKKLRNQYSRPVIIPVIPAGRDDLLRTIVQLDTFFYIKKPYIPAEIEIAVSRAAEKIILSFSESEMENSADPSNFHGIIGKSPCMLRLFDLIAKIAEDGFSNVLIRGESGTGKELVAKAIHSHSKRKNNKFVPVNCAAIPDDLLESELFGHTKGAFTGATQNKIGRIQYADGGTLFLDEIGDMKASLQAKLLRVLQEKEFEPVGALKAIPVDTRILAATHCDLEQLVNEGTFREDLYYRLSVIPLIVPPLKDRREDIPLLLDFFSDVYTKKRGREPIGFSPQVMSILMHYEWRGNVRELENFVQHMCILCSGREIAVSDLPEKFLSSPAASLAISRSSEQMQPSLRSPAYLFQNQPNITDLQWDEGRIDFNEMVNELETQLILHALKIAGGNKKEAAKLLNLKRTTLLEKMKKKELTGIFDNPADHDPLK